MKFYNFSITEQTLDCIVVQSKEFTNELFATKEEAENKLSTIIEKYCLKFRTNKQNHSIKYDKDNVVITSDLLTIEINIKECVFNGSLADVEDAFNQIFEVNNTQLPQVPVQETIKKTNELELEFDNKKETKEENISETITDENKKKSKKKTRSFWVIEGDGKYETVKSYFYQTLNNEPKWTGSLRSAQKFSSFEEADDICKYFGLKRYSPRLKTVEQQ